MWGGGRERETDRQRERERDRQTDREKERETEMFSTALGSHQSGGDGGRGAKLLRPLYPIAGCVNRTVSNGTWKVSKTPSHATHSSVVFLTPLKKPQQHEADKENRRGMHAVSL